MLFTRTYPILFMYCPRIPPLSLFVRIFFYNLYDNPKLRHSHNDNLLQIEYSISQGVDDAKSPAISAHNSFCYIGSWL